MRLWQSRKLAICPRSPAGQDADKGTFLNAIRLRSNCVPRRGLSMLGPRLVIRSYSFRRRLTTRGQWRPGRRNKKVLIPFSDPAQ
jgi:hypothetical protein